MSVSVIFSQPVLSAHRGWYAKAACTATSPSVAARVARLKRGFHLTQRTQRTQPNAIKYVTDAINAMKARKVRSKRCVASVTSVAVRPLRCVRCVGWKPRLTMMSTSAQRLPSRGVREGLFLFPFPPIPMIKTYSHSHFLQIPLFPIPIPITAMKFLEISKAKKCIIRHI